MNYFGYDVTDWIECECGCGNKAVDIHHLDPRKMGGNKSKDCIKNLVALTRECHVKAEKDKVFNEKLKLIHSKKLKI